LVPVPAEAFFVAAFFLGADLVVPDFFFTAIADSSSLEVRRFGQPHEAGLVSFLL
jgi:hypothetical protein